MNILILTSVYRDESLGKRDRSTNIVNSFVKEWSRQGHSIIVIHNSHSYPRFIHDLPKRIKSKLEFDMGFPISDYDGVRKKYFEQQGAKVFRIPIKKYIPHTSPGNSAIKNQVKKINEILEKNKFKPDVITGHWASPQMEIISELKSIYNCKTAIVLHGMGYINSEKFNASKYIGNIDRIGTRSAYQAKQAKEILDLDEMPFICNSGVPDDYLDHYNLNLNKYENIKKWKITFVGRLVSYKNVDSIIKALSNIEVEWELNIVGDGAQEEELKKLTERLNCDDKVNFLGRISRDEVMEVLQDTHIFIMISTNEVFGLVYLEAMAASCLTIASKDGGVDGVIRNNLNGYLCKQGDSYELNKLLKKIMSSEVEEIKKIANNAYVTANKYSDYNVAKSYLEKITR